MGSCGDWNQFEDNKCLKVIEKKTTEEDSIKSCKEEDSTSSLITIDNKEEQEFLNTFLEKYNNITANVWIGLKYTDKAFKWLDGSDVNYTNWAEDAVKDGTLACVQMSIAKGSGLGKWTDQSCKKLGLIVCQKSQKNIDSNDLKAIVDNLVKTVEKQQKTIDRQQKAIDSMTGGLVPLGFIYTQLPNQSEPGVLWPTVEWSDVTKDYSGLFFRAEGLDSEKFGKIQQANYSRLSNVEVWSSEMDGWRDDRKHNLGFPLEEGKWTNIKPGGLIYWLKLYNTQGNNRPKNTAVKIWKRVK